MNHPLGWGRAIAIVLLTLAAGHSLAHPAFERYIPIGESPGLSGSGTYIGRIREAEEADYTLVVQGEDRSRRTIRVVPSTDVWVDRSRRRRTNTAGGFEDCRPGRRVEVLLRGDSDEAQWVKVEGR